MLKLVWLLYLPASYSGCTYFPIRSMISYFTFCFNIKNALNLNNIDFCRINYDLECKDKSELYFESFNDSQYGKC